MIEIKLEKKEERNIKRYDTEKFINFAKLFENEPDLFEELANDYPVEDNTSFIINVKKEV